MCWPPSLTLQRLFLPSCIGFDKVIERLQSFRKSPLTLAFCKAKCLLHDTCPGGGMVDALASGASTRKGVEVRVLSWAPFPSFQRK